MRRPRCSRVRSPRRRTDRSSTGVEALESRQLPATFLVSNTGDDGPGSLRQAILDANSTAGADTIGFDVPGAGLHAISPARPLPIVSDQVAIDGTTHSGYSGQPLIELDGMGA